MHIGSFILLRVVFPSNSLLAPCKLCRMQVTPYALEWGHRSSKLCTATAQCHNQHWIIQHCQEAATIRFHASGTKLGMVNVLWYLGHLLSATDSDWPALYHNMTKA